MVMLNALKCQCQKVNNRDSHKPTMPSDDVSSPDELISKAPQLHEGAKVKSEQAHKYSRRPTVNTHLPSEDVCGSVDSTQLLTASLT